MCQHRVSHLVINYMFVWVAIHKFIFRNEICTWHGVCEQSSGRQRLQLHGYECQKQRSFQSNGEAVDRSQSATEWRRQLKIYFYETGNATCVTTTSGRMMVHTRVVTMVTAVSAQYYVGSSSSGGVERERGVCSIRSCGKSIRDV